MDKENNIVYFAKTNFRGEYRIFGIRKFDRRQHMYIVGKTGTGKSSLLYNMLIQDIVNKEGLCFIDPHGEIAQKLVKKIPKERVDDVIYFDPADNQYVIGFNILELPDEKYKNLVASGLMSIFKKIWSNVWSARMEYILNNAILALVDTPGSTLLGINRILTDKIYRQYIVNNIKDPIVKSFWINEFEQWNDNFRNEAIAPIQNKVGQFLSNSIIRNIVGQEKSTINISQIMNEGKVLILNLSKGKIGEDNSSLLGAMFITKIQLAAMERVKIEEEKRKDFYLYVDEFQNFATDSFATILSEARKYRLNLIIAHQYIGQLETDVSEKVKNAVFGNIGTIIVFRISAKDALFLEKEFLPEISIDDLINLPNYNIYVKLVVNGVTTKPFSAVTLPPFEIKDSLQTEIEIIKKYYQKYARPIKEVVKEIQEWSNKTDFSLGQQELICQNCNKNYKKYSNNSESLKYCQNCLYLLGKDNLVFRKRDNLKKLFNLGIEFRKINFKFNKNKIKKNNKINNNFIQEEISLNSLLNKEKEQNKKDFNISKENKKEKENLIKNLKEEIEKILNKIEEQD
ncbi:MAG: type IV secretion system DNA-binding domain-containing protein [Candidatus Pacearchaeota archaeon]